MYLSVSRQIIWDGDDIILSTCRYRFVKWLVLVAGWLAALAVYSLSLYIIYIGVYVLTFGSSILLSLFGGISQFEQG